MKRLVGVIICFAIGFLAYQKVGGVHLFNTPEVNGVRYGATEAEVESVLGPPLFASPNFGNPQRIYKTATGGRVMMIYTDGKVVEIHVMR